MKRVRRLERGDAGADSGALWYSAWMFGIVVFGLMIAIWGFWRASASAAAERDAYARGVRDNGSDAGIGGQFFAGLTGRGGASLTSTENGATVVVRFRHSEKLSSPISGQWEADQDVTIEKYLERFRPIR